VVDVEQVVQDTEVPEVLHLHSRLLPLEVAVEVVVIQALDLMEVLEEELLEDFQELLDQVILPQLVPLKEMMEDHQMVLRLTQEPVVEEQLL
jgi:hypothetical protein